MFDDTTWGKTMPETSVSVEVRTKLTAEIRLPRYADSFIQNWTDWDFPDDPIWKEDRHLRRVVRL